PSLAFQNHLFVNSRIPSHAPLLAYVITNGWKSLTTDTFMSRCNEIWSAHGLSSGHSFRIGRATEMLLRGVDPKLVMVQGRWSSDAFLRYWRKIEEIL
ncbi:hypothetical protein M407DRAFT_50059, partial [Tulasnella calospora MUT 4182]